MKQSLVRIRVHTPFTFTHPNYEVEKFSAGLHSVAPEVAENWFTTEHAEVIDGGKVTVPARRRRCWRRSPTCRSSWRRKKQSSRPDDGT